MSICRPVNLCTWKAGCLSSACLSLFFESIFPGRAVEAVGEEASFTHAYIGHPHIDVLRFLFVCHIDVATVQISPRCRVFFSVYRLYFLFRIHKCLQSENLLIFTHTDVGR
jgi:hypothetical protein